MAKHIRIKKEETLADNFFPLKKVTYEFENKKGKDEELSREVYCSTNGAAALLYNMQQETVILICQFRLPAYLNHHPTGQLLEVCAGILEEGEAPGETIVREIEEETGYHVDDVQKVFEMFMTPGSVKEMLHLYVAEYHPEQKKGKGGGLEDESEEIEVVEMPFDEAYGKVLSNEIKDAKTVLLLQYAKLHLFGNERVFQLL